MKEVFTFDSVYAIRGDSLVAQTAKNLPAMRKTWVRSLGWEDPWGREWQPIPVFLPGESPWTEEPGGLQSVGLPRVRNAWNNKAQHRCSWLDAYMTQGNNQLMVFSLFYLSYKDKRTLVDCFFRNIWFQHIKVHAEKNSRSNLEFSKVKG